MARLFPASLVAAIYCGLAAIPASAGAPLQDVPPAETRLAPFTGDLPPCDDSFVLWRIMIDFSERETEYWGNDLVIQDFQPPRETGFRKHGESFIPRRRCEARARFSDGSIRRVAYEIAEDQGFLGLGWGVHWRVDGLDREHETSFGR
ncbi:MAG TPA: hypothetical protein VK446_12690 [Methylocystis sp.]|nr:hypothetical protein [Methylocystis sp.]